MTSTNKNIAITGGHPTPALAMTEYFSSRGFQVFFMGNKHTPRTYTPTFEHTEATQLNTQFYDVAADRGLWGLLKLPCAVWGAYKYIRANNIQKLLCFGSYVAVPCAIAAYIAGLDIYTHEQTLYPGLANKFVALFARRVFVSFDETQKFFGSSKVIQTGCPLRLAAPSPADKAMFDKLDSPVILVACGSLGSMAINELVFSNLDWLLERASVIHLTGRSNNYADYTRASKIINPRYVVFDLLSSAKYAAASYKADLIIGRCGANSFFERFQTKTPFLAIPLPISRFNEQKLQAQKLVELGVGEMLEADVSPTQFRETVSNMLSNLANYKKNYAKAPNYDPTQAAQLIFEAISNGS